jgi:excinuclease ABC subunit C
MVLSMLPLIEDQQKLKTILQQIPELPGVYLMRRDDGDILYVGKSKKLRSRIRSYFQDSQKLSVRIVRMVSLIRDIEFIVTDNEVEALALEANLIKRHQPYYNVLLKDDKRYPYLCITWSEVYPRIFITRKRVIGDAKDRYYGPYVDSKLLGNVLTLVKKIFPLRQRSKPLFKDRTCLNYDLHRCPGVCQQLITPEQYRQTVQQAAMIFQGRTTELINLLQSQMEKAAEQLNFEQAANLRDQIKALKSLNIDQKVSLPDDTITRDAIALAANEQQCCIQLFQIRSGNIVGRLGFFSDMIGTPGEILQRVLEEHYSRVEPEEIPTEILVQQELSEGEILMAWLQQRKGKKVTIIVPQRQGKAQLIELVEKNAYYELERLERQANINLQSLQDLAKILDLPTLPRRIEGYDISHIQGSHAVGSQVVFLDGIPAKQYYRHYKIKNPTVKIGHSDDFRSLQEVITRRFAESNNQDDSPDLIMIDGGKGQLSVVLEALQEIDIADKFKIVSLAKQREEIFIPGSSEPLLTDSEQPGVQLLRRVRDEAHRFAVSFHRQQRWNHSKRSVLDAIPGLGLQRQKELLAHFHSIDYIRQASKEQLQQVSGIGSSLAEAIYNYFR